MAFFSCDFLMSFFSCAGLRPPGRPIHQPRECADEVPWRDLVWWLRRNAFRTPKRDYPGAEWYRLQTTVYDYI